MRGKALIAGISIVWMSFCAVQLARADDSGPNLDQVYDQIFPYYTIECSVTQLHKIGEQPGGIGGHALLYLKGVCRDQSVDYPKVKMCDPAKIDLKDRNSGVAVSVDKILMNTRFVVTDGKDFMFNGDLAPNEPLNEKTLTSTIQAVVSSGALRGVEVHPQYLADKPAGMSTEEYIARVGADTDYALSFGRKSTCVRIPMNAAQMSAEVDRINELNEPYVTGRKKYEWRGISDSCVDFTHNVLAAAGIRHSVSTGPSIFRQAFDLMTLHFQVPANDVLAQAEWVTRISAIGTAEQVYKNKDLRDAFLKFGRLPVTPGAVMEQVPMHLTDNELYQPANGVLMLDVPFLDPRHKKLEKMLSNPVTSNILASLIAFQKRFDQVSAERKPIPASASPEFASFARKYNQWVDESVQSIAAKIAILTGSDQP